MSVEPAGCVGDIGESGLLDLVQRYCLEGTVGDDAAVLTPPAHNMVATTDVLVESIHFSDSTTPPYSVGWRAATANLSDLAAMGARPLYLTLALGLPPETPIAWVNQLYTGLTDCCRPWHAELVGGDLARSSQRFVSITAIGTVEPDRTIRRSEAKLGDVLVATGYHGNSRAGLELLLHPERDNRISDPHRHTLIAAHQHPRPRLDLLPILHHLRATGHPISGMDTSDGLADAVVQVCQQSGVGAAIAPNRIPLSPALTSSFTQKALDWALYGGEDFELLLAMPNQAAELFVQRVSTAVPIGRIVEASRGIVLTGKGHLQRQSAFQHFNHQ